MTTPNTYGLIGYPLGHSFSREFFTKKFRREHIEAQYLNFEIEDIGLLMEILAEYPQLKGLNVTSPYKELALAYTNKLSEVATDIGATNTLRITNTENGPIVEGFNTDAQGFALDIKQVLPADCSGLKALVAGSGGASRAVCYALRRMGIEPTIVSRSPKDGQLSYKEVNQEVITKHIVIINATPLGMKPQESECIDIPYEAVTTSHVCYDLIYNPSPTEFLKRCSAQGAAIRGGLGMLENQAKLSWKIWNNNEDLL